MTVRRPKKPRSRRNFLRTAVMGIGVIGSALLGYLPVLGNANRRIRPPGALDEHDFLASCIKCGQCVQVCPVEAIKLADIDEGFSIGTPFIETRKQACDFSCDGLQCVLACPTGALTHEINYSHETEMGWARVERPELCLAARGQGFKGQARGPDFKGLLRYAEIDRWSPIRVSDYDYDLEVCDLCVRQCPIEIRRGQCEAGTPPSGDENQCPPKKAISLEVTADGGLLPVIHEGCVGCGVCEMICPTEPAVIVMDWDRSTGVAA